MAKILLKMGCQPCKWCQKKYYKFGVIFLYLDYILKHFPFLKDIKATNISCSKTIPN